MDLIRWAMNRPVTIAVGVLLVVIFGLLGLTAIPIQLTPTIDRPIITVTTNWPGRSPEEIVDDITKEQEERLKNVSGLRDMVSTSREGSAEISLEFYIGTPLSRALQEVSDALRQVPEYPEEVDEPTIKAAEGAAENAIAWIIIDIDPEWHRANPQHDITTFYTAFDRDVKPFIERIGGVAEVNIYGGREKEVRVNVDPVRLAQRGLTYGDVLLALRRENRNISAGTIAEGKRDYRVRVVGKFDNPDDILQTIVAYRDGLPVMVKDVATAEVGFQKRRGFVRSLGEPCMAMNVIRQSGSNVVDIMADLRVELDRVRTEILPTLDPEVGKHLRMRQVYDETTYIDAAIDLVLGNLWIAALLSALVLLAFLRSWKSTLLIVLSIPVSIVGTFLVMLAMGRTLNVISLAGLAFATGMVVDAANVVLENIDRRRSMGDPPLTAIYRGTKEVWGAILASTLTTVMVFLPVLTVREEAGQLFFDLTLALAVSVSLSLIVAVLVVPAAAAVLLKNTRVREVDKPHTGVSALFYNVFGLAPLCVRLTRRLGDLIHWLITGWRASTLRPLIIVLMAGGSILGSVWLVPPLDYLPAGNRNLVFGGLLVPPGMSVEQMEDYAQRIERQVEPYVRADITKPETVAALPPIMRFDDPTKTFDPVPVANFFIGSFNGGMFVGGVSADDQVVIPIGNLFTGVMIGLPDSFGGARQSSLFGRGVTGGSSISVEISGPRLDRVTAAAQAIFMSAAMNPRYGFGNVRPNPANFNLGQQEFRVRLSDAGRRLGLRTEDLGVAARGLFDGAFVGDFRLDGRNVDLVVVPTGDRLENKESLANIPIVTPSGQVVPIASVVDFVPARAAQEIRRIEELPAVSVDVTPPQGMTVDEVIADLRANVIDPARAAGLVDPSMRVRLKGTAAQLDEVQSALFGKSAEPNAPRRVSVWSRAGEVIAGAFVLLGLAGVAVAFVKMARAGRAPRSLGGSRGGGRAPLVYGALGIALLAASLAGIFLAISAEPQLLYARFIWALLVTYLLMCALFENWLYPLVIMFSVPLGTLGGFAALGIVHAWTLRTPTISPQNLDVLTMIGFVTLIGTVVNNAILLVEQSLNFMNPAKLGEAFADDKALSPTQAIAESVRTRVRPIFMTSLTTVVGGLPLILAPGAGSEMYRGFGTVVTGGLLVSTVFTLILVPLAMSLMLDLVAGVRRVLGSDRNAGPAQPTPFASEPGTVEHRAQAGPVAV